MAIRVLVNGARGRMGRDVVRSIRGQEDLLLVGETDLGDDLEASIRKAEAGVVVDFTRPDCAVANTETILRSGACPVVGTTGFGGDDIRRLRGLAADLGRGGLIAPNFALGAVLLMKFAADAARYFPDVEVIELHHEQKLDAPSGTALKTIELIRTVLDEQSSGERPNRGPARPSEHESVQSARGGRYLGIPVHSVRLPGYVAHQEVLFGGPGQFLTLRHDATSRECFMPGVLLAVRAVPELSELFYGLDELLAKG